MIEIFLLAALLISTLVFGGYTLILGLRRLGRASDTGATPRFKKAALRFLSLVVATVLLVLISQYGADTPDIRDSEDAIAELRQVELNGRKQWISIRGQSRENPVLLFLAGGPGGTQLAAVRYELAALEAHFIVVGWDQPGAGKSCSAVPAEDITAETYIEDGYALTNYLRETFGQQKIFLVGESWGSALGIFLIDRYPEVYEAFIGTGQMVDFDGTERLNYEKALELAVAADDRKTIDKLEANGPPPYYGSDVVWKSAVYLNYLSAAMAQNPAIHNAGYNTFRDIFSSEYGLLDKVNFFRGLVNTYNQVYPQLYEIDLRTDYARLEVPVYFFEGRHDINAPTALVEEYLAVLDAPDKEIVWFEHSGHSPWINERDKFVQELLARFQEGA